VSGLRRATVEDAPEVLAVHRTARGSAYAHLAPPDAAAGKSTVESWRLSIETSDAWVLEREDRIIGFALLQGDLLRELYVLPEAQGTGAGHTLLQTVVDHGARALWVYVDNSVARRFYERHGWVEEPGTAHADPEWAIVEPAVRYRLSAP
jgi:GNAT superfamily N-acetyltransferase